jgi:hypothetical protein
VSCSFSSIVIKIDQGITYPTVGESRNVFFINKISEIQVVHLVICNVNFDQAS